jgi:hypothetical protein
MFKKDSGARSPVAINELVCDVVSTSLGELQSRRAEAGMRVMFADIEAKPLGKAVAASKAVCPTAK